MRKFWTVLAAVPASAVTLLSLSACGGNETFAPGSYSCEGAAVAEIRLDLSDREVAIERSQDGKIYIDYFTSDKEYYDIAVEDETLSVSLVSDKDWTDYIGTKPDARFRLITLRLPDTLFTSLEVKTTNANVHISPAAFESVAVDVNGGDIAFEELSANSICLTAKNGNVSGSVLGGWDDFAITCRIKKGESNLHEHKEGGEKTLTVDCNNGDVDISFERA